jgi:hypothetical protein
MGVSPMASNSTPGKPLLKSNVKNLGGRLHQPRGEQFNRFFASDRKMVVAKVNFDPKPCAPRATNFRDLVRVGMGKYAGRNSLVDCCSKIGPFMSGQSHLTAPQKTARSTFARSIEIC